MDAFQILVIVLSVTLVIFLVVAIMMAYKLMQVLEHIKRISERAEKVVDNVEHVSSFFQKAAGPMAVSRIVTMFVKAFRKQHKRRGDS